MIRSVILSLILALSLPASANDFGLQDPSLAESFRQEARSIASRDAPLERSAATPSAEQEQLINSDEDLNRAYSNDPAATIELIDRILKATRAQTPE